MREILSQVDSWREAGEPIAVATVIATWGSAPRAVGAKMAMTEGGGIAGSVSGGCVEGAVVEAGNETVRSGRPQLLRFGVSDEKAWQVGLACGGEISVFVERLDSDLYDRLRSLALGTRSGVAATVVRGPDGLIGRKILVDAEGGRTATLSGEAADLAARAAQEAASQRQNRIVTLRDPASGESFDLFVEIVEPPPTLAIVGGVHIAIALTTLARSVGFRTIVVDPREAFGNEERFRDADFILASWPGAGLRQMGLTPSTAVAVLTHDPKLDDPALLEALPSEAFYVGALGSRRTQEKRRQRLLEAGLSQEHLDRLHAPIGLDLGGRGPEEIALAVLAEIVAVRNRKTPAL